MIGCGPVLGGSTWVLGLGPAGGIIGVLHDGPISRELAKLVEGSAQQETYGMRPHDCVRHTCRTFGKREVVLPTEPLFIMLAFQRRESARSQY